MKFENGENFMIGNVNIFLLRKNHLSTISIMKITTLLKYTNTIIKQPENTNFMKVNFLKYNK